MAGTEAFSDGLLIARQPILDRDRRVFAYQLLVRSLPPASGAATRPSPFGSASDALERCGLESSLRP